MSPSSRPTRPRPLPAPTGLAAEIALRLHLAGAQAAARYDLAVLRLGHVAPPTLPHRMPTAARDGDLARIEAQQRYARLTLTRQQQLAAAHPTAWQNLLAGRSAAAPQTSVSAVTQTPDHNTPEAARRRVAGHRAGQQIDHLREDQALNNTLGEGIGYGFAAAAAELAPEVAALRLAGGLRWAGATRAAVVATRLAEQASWAGAEGELIGVRSGWQGLRKAPGQAVSRGVFDVIGQGGAGYLSSDRHGWDRFVDAGLGINGIETGMAMYGIRPFGISVGSAAFQISGGKGYQSIFNGRVSPRAFLAQAAIGTTMGHFGEYTGGILNRHLAYRLYQGAILRLGEDVAYPVWLGSSQLFKKAVPASFGVTEEYYEGVAQDYWPAEGERP